MEKTKYELLQEFAKEIKENLEIDDLVDYEKAKKKKDSCKNKGDIYNVKNNVAQNQIFIKGDSI